MWLPVALALASSLCFGIALVSAKVGLRTLDARSGAAISIPTATMLFALAAPFALDASGFSVGAAIIFGAVGFFFPAVVTLITFRSNERLGPTVTSALSGTAPLFALVAAGVLLGEKIPAHAVLAAAGVVAGIVLLSGVRAPSRGSAGWGLLWPLAGAALRGLAQAIAKAGLIFWPNPFAASLIGYTVSCVTVVGADSLRRGDRQRRSRRSVLWFALTGILNGAAVLLMYGALSSAPVSTVAPLVASYPLVTALASAAFLREEPLTPRVWAGAGVTVAAIIYLVAW